MKPTLILFLATLTFTISYISDAQSLAPSCPDLQGIYTCVAEDGYESRLEIEQRVENGVMVYNDLSDDYITDGKPHAVDWGGFIGRYTSQCFDAKVGILLQGELFFDDGEKFADVTDDSYYKKVDSNTIEMGFVYTRKQMNGKEVHLEGKETCTRSE